VTGRQMYELLERLFPLNRSLTGEGVRQTLAVLKEYNPAMRFHSIPSGTKVFDWTVPKEWHCEEAYILAPDGERICDYNRHNLHLVQYSVPFEGEMPLEALQKHLYSYEPLPDAIPYVTSYYKPRWGFCLSERQRQRLKNGIYKVVIRSKLWDGVLDYADIVLPGDSEEEIMFSTYICHPSMANNELSGPVVATALARFVASLPNRRYTYRFVFAPETIGSLVYMHTRLPHLKSRVKAGFILTCVGDERGYSYLASRYGDTLADRVARNILEQEVGAYRAYSYLQRGSDERQYCAPGADLPFCSVMRTKYGEYPEYHTSLDDLNLVTPEGLEGALEVYKKIVVALERNHRYRVTVVGEPQLGKRGLYPDACTPDTDYDQAFLYRNFLAYADGRNDLITIAEILNVSAYALAEVARLFEEHRLVERVKKASQNST